MMMAAEPPAGTALAALLAEEIRRAGPISLARFMALALGHPEHGYYHARQPLGRAGDFVTAPEISQMFGELIGLWLAQAWQDQGRPAPLRLVELGPGSGQLMADLLRATAKLPDFQASLELHLVEFSQALRARQEQRLAGWPVVWHAELASVPAGPCFYLANEFFDALPVLQLLRTEPGWRERRIGLGARGGLDFVLAEPPPALLAELAAHGLSAAAPGAIAELSPAREAIAGLLARRIARQGGLALLIDYGAERTAPLGDTLQAVRGHQPVDPLAWAGLADLSSQVDFTALGRAAARAGAAVYGPVPQGPFLRTLGIELRALQLLRQAAPTQHRALRAGLFRLTDASAMGELFKVMVLAAPGAPAPPGFLAPSQPGGGA